MKDLKWVCAMLAVAVACAGPLAPVTALAQQPVPPPAPMQSMQSMQTEAGAPPPPPPGRSAEIGAAALNVVHVPGKAILCGFGTLVAGGLMLLTFGSAYRPAVSFFKEGCEGPWLITPEEVASVPSRSPFGY